MSDRKRPYVKPEFERVKLVPEEAVLGGCKTSSGDGIGTSAPAGNCQVASCVTNATS